MLITQFVSNEKIYFVPKVDVSSLNELGNKPSISRDIIFKMKYYLYRHVRIDKKVPFYIGIGTKPNKYNTHKAEYKRAYQKWGRNKHWKSIVKKTNYVIDIVFESNSYEAVKNKEIELIELYKKTIVNYTKGGQGTLGFNGSSHPKSKKVYQYNKDGSFIKEWESIGLASKHLNIFSTNIVACLKGINKSSGGYMWSYENKNKLNPMVNLTGKNQKTKISVYKIDILTNKILETFSSIKEAAKSVNIHCGKISECCSGKRKTVRNFKWSYEK